MGDTPNYVYLLNALNKLNADVEYTTGDTYESIVWKENAVNIPTKEIVDSKVLELKNTKPFIFLRNERKKKLTESDYLAMPDYPHINDTLKQEWLLYRQALRDLPSTVTPQLDENGDLTNVTWPTPPS
jgi:hypothetical protein